MRTRTESQNWPSVIRLRQRFPTASIRSNPDYPLTYRWLAASLGQIGQTEDAKRALEKAIAIAPASFDMYVHQRAPWIRLEDHVHMLEGLRKAGWEG